VTAYAAANPRTSAPAGVAVEVRNWGWRHAGRRAFAVRGFTLSLAPGERVLLAGRSGAGKSTLLAGLAGLLDPETAEEVEGEIRLDGAPVRQARQRAGLLQQDPQAGIVLARAGDDVAFGPECWGVPPDEIWRRVRESLGLVGFPYALDRSTSALSGGEAQRLGLAGLLALRPGLLLLDEPTANLDPDGVRQVRDAVARVLAATGASLVLVEHRPEPWLPLIDRVVELGEQPCATALPAWRPPAPGGVLLQASKVRHRHPGAEADAPGETSLDVRAGEAVAVTGRNGAGKTTLALTLGGLLKPTGGTAVAPTSPDQRPLHRWRADALAAHVGSVFQRPGQQFLARTVRDDVALGAAPGTDVAALLARLRLGHLARAHPHTLSGGEQRRLSVATALAAQPAVLVLDEPTFGQDRETWNELVALLRTLLDDGHGVVVVTHDRLLVDALAAREVRLP